MSTLKFPNAGELGTPGLARIVSKSLANELRLTATFGFGHPAQRQDNIGVEI